MAATGNDCDTEVELGLQVVVDLRSVTRGGSHDNDGSIVAVYKENEIHPKPPNTSSALGIVSSMRPLVGPEEDVNSDMAVNFLPIDTVTEEIVGKQRTGEGIDNDRPDCSNVITTVLPKRTRSSSQTENSTDNSLYTQLTADLYAKSAANVYPRSEFLKCEKGAPQGEVGVIDVAFAKSILDDSKNVGISGVDAYNSAVCLSERTRGRGAAGVNTKPTINSRQQRIRQWWVKNKTYIHWLLIWAVVWVYIGYAHFFVNDLLTQNEAEGEETNNNIWLRYSLAAKPYRTQFRIYFGVVAAVSLCMVLTVALLVYRHVRDPAIAVLNPVFLTHVCSMSFIMLIADAVAQFRILAYSEWQDDDWRLAVISFSISFSLQFFMMAPLLRLRAMYLVFVLSIYDVKHSWLVLRAVIQCALTSSTVWLAFGPSRYFWLIGWGARVGFGMIVIEMIFYAVKLRECKYLQKQFGMTLHMCNMALFTLNFSGFLLTLLHPICNMVDQFHAVNVLLWLCNMELIGPALYQTYWVRLRLPYGYNKPTPRGVYLANSGLDAILHDSELFAILMRCAKRRYCEESLLFIRDADALLALLETHSEDDLTESFTLEREAHVQSFLEKYVVSGATHPINISSGQLALYHRIYAGLAAKRGLDVSELTYALGQSLQDIEELFEASGVLTMYDLDVDRIELIKMRATVARLGFVVETDSVDRV